MSQPSDILDPPGQSADFRFSKVPEITVLFWIIKVLTTGMGETTSDYFVRHFDPHLAVAAGFVCFMIALAFQFAAPRYEAWIYWMAVVMVSVFGTMAADVLHVVLGVPYIASTTVFALSLALIFLMWQRSEGTLSIHSIHSRRREAFYWGTVLATFALGTAAGDMTAMTLGMGFLTSGLFFAGLIAVPVIAYRFLGLGEIPAFWFAYIVTRPLGASFADWMGRSHERGGLSLGTGTVSLALFMIILALVGFLAVTRTDVEPEEALDTHL